MFAKSISFWTLSICIILLFLEANRDTGEILNLFGVFLLLGVMFHVLLLFLFIEAFFERIPRVFIFIPFLLYGSYYIYYIYQSLEIRSFAAGIRRENPTKQVDFDIANSALVTPNAVSLASNYAIPVVYLPDSSGRSTYPLIDLEAFRLLDRPNCDRVIQALLRAPGAQPYLTEPVESSAPTSNTCLFRHLENPKGELFTVSSRQLRVDKPGFHVEAHEFRRDGKVFATFRTASVARLPIFPFLVVAWNFTSYSSRFSATFLRNLEDPDRFPERLDTIPDGIDQSLYDTPEGVVLGLRKYSPNDYARLVPSPEALGIIRELAQTEH